MKSSLYFTDKSTGTEFSALLDSELSLLGEEQLASLLSFSNSARLSAKRSSVCLKSIAKRGAGAGGVWGAAWDWAWTAARCEDRASRGLSLYKDSGSNIGVMGGEVRGAEGAAEEAAR